MKKKYRIECVNLPRKSVSRSHVEKLGQALFKQFSENRKLLTLLSKFQENPDLSVVFVSKIKSREINLKYRKKNYATDVLSFSQKVKARGLGEIILCVSVLQKQAKEHDLSFTKEMDYMIIHGFLHLLGYDHEKSRKEELKMMKLQDRLFEQLTK